MNKIIAEHIQAYLDKSGVSKVIFIQNIGMDLATLNMIFEDKAKISLDLAVRIANEIGISLDELVGRAVTIHYPDIRAVIANKKKLYSERLNMLEEFEQFLKEA